MKLKPLHKRVVVVPQKADEVTEGGIYIPDSAAEKPMEGIVVAVGPEAPALITEGAYVIYAKNAGQQVKVDDEDFLIIDSDEIISVVEK